MNDAAWERLFGEMRAEPPPGLHERLLAAARDPERRSRLRAEELGDAARAALLPSCAGLLLALLVAGALLGRSGPPLPRGPGRPVDQAPPRTPETPPVEPQRATDPWLNVVAFDVDAAIPSAWPMEAQ